MRDRQRAFVEHYLRTWNATEAARQAGYSRKTAHAQGWENLRKPEIRAAIDERLKEFGMGADEVLARLAAHAGGSLEGVLNDKGEFDFAKARAGGGLQLIRKLKEITRTDGDGHQTKTVEVELYDAQAALVHLGRHHQLFTDQVKLRSWRDDVIDLLRDGKITPEQVIAEYGDELGQELAGQAGHAKHDAATAIES